MYFRSSRKSSMDISMNEPIETDKNGNTLTLMDTMSTGDTILDTINTKINVQKRLGYNGYSHNHIAQQNHIFCPSV